MKGCLNSLSLGFATLGMALSLTAAARASGPAPGQDPNWPGYLDYAYVYSSAEPADLEKRLETYSREIGLSLDDYIVERYASQNVELSEIEQRRKAIAYLLEYIARGDPQKIRQSARAIERLSDRLDRHENRYWYHYIRAHRALHFGDAELFSQELFSLWIGVVAELEEPFDTYRTLSLGESAATGFVAGLPYLYENIARIILFRSQSLGLDRSIDSLAALLRLLGDGRIGAFGEIIAESNSSSEYLDYVLTRLEGDESDGGSLTFTLALVAAEKAHHEASRSLADAGFTEGTRETIRVAIGSYRRALRHAVTLQGQAAVYTRVLRQMGEIQAASGYRDEPRRGEPELDFPFSISDAIEVYAALHRDRDGGWERDGFYEVGREAYVRVMHGLWQEIQEASLNAAEYQLGLGATRNGRFENERINASVGHYSEFLAMFRAYALKESAELVPDSAYYGAHLAARGIGIAVLHYNADNPTNEQVDLALDQFTEALIIYPFDRRLWSSVAVTLERMGQESRYLEIVKPPAEKVSRSSYVDRWIRAKEARSSELLAYRKALGNDLAIMYLGFADDRSVAEMESVLADLRARRRHVTQQMASLDTHRERLATQRKLKLAGTADESPGLPAVSEGPPVAPGETATHIAGINEELRDLTASQDRLDAQLLGRARALELYEGTLGGDSFAARLAAQREQPLHGLIRRLFYEDETQSRFQSLDQLGRISRETNKAPNPVVGRPGFDRRNP